MEDYSPSYVRYRPGAADSKYLALMPGSKGCPSALSVSSAECQAAAKDTQFGAGGKDVHEGRWDHVPPGCSLLGRDPYYNSHTGRAAGTMIPICKQVPKGICANNFVRVLGPVRAYEVNMGHVGVQKTKTVVPFGLVCPPRVDKTNWGSTLVGKQLCVPTPAPPPRRHPCLAFGSLALRFGPHDHDWRCFFGRNGIRMQRHAGV